MTLNLISLNIAIIVLLTFLMEQGLRKILLTESKHIKRVYWIGLFPSYVTSVTAGDKMVLPQFW